MKLPPLKIGDLIARIPIIQGGMGIGVSLSRLASAVANEGGIGVISTAQIGFKEPDFFTNTLEANVRALRREIRSAKNLSPNGIIGLNLMVAMTHYRELAEAAVEEGIDLIISGAGLPTELPSIVKGTKTKIAPIVSSGKAASVISKYWDRKHQYIADLVVVEGPEAGGHLGFSMEQLAENPGPKLIDIVKDVIEAIKPYEEKYNKKIPVVAAGGIYTGEDIAKHMRNGASGVQIATRFVATDECDADIKYKMAYLNCKEEELMIVKSPVGMPGRAIKNRFIDRVNEHNIPVKRCFKCLKNCNPESTPYCITMALIEAVKGNTEDGLIFTGKNAYRLNKIVSVKELIHELVSTAEIAY